jgi:hypothetical protein
MFSKRKNATVTLKVCSLQMQKSDQGEFQVKWARRSKSGVTRQNKLDSDNMIFFNEAFPINANFIILKNGQWREKTVDIKLLHYTVFKKTKVNTWKLNLADLRENVTITKELEFNSDVFGRLVLVITLFRGLPSEMPSTPMAKLPMKFSRTIGSQAALQTQGPTLEASPNHGLATLKRNAFNDPRPKASFFNLQLPATQSEFTIEISDECLKLRNNEYDCTSPDIPKFGEKIAYMFLSQPRGTSYETAIENVVQVLEEMALGEFKTARYCFLSLVYLYSLLRSNGLPTKTTSCDMADSLVKMFNTGVNTVTQQLGSALQNPDTNLEEIVYPIFEHNTKIPFSNYMNSLIIFCVAIESNPTVGRKIIQKFKIHEQRFFDASILDKPENEEIMSVSEAFKFANACLFDSPSPPLPREFMFEN